MKRFFRVLIVTSLMISFGLGYAPTKQTVEAATTGCEPTWNTVKVPKLFVESGTLANVTAVSPQEIWTFGTGAFSQENTTLIEKWDGYKWKVIGSPNPTFYSFLQSGAAVASNDIWAVGDSAAQTLTVHWNGSTWNTVSSPSFGTTVSELEGAAAIAANDIWAVGIEAGNAGSLGLILHGDGVNWDVVSHPNLGNDNLRAVAAAAANDVWAVGDYHPAPTGSTPIPSQTEILHYNGTDWHVVASPNVGTGGNWLKGVAVVAANDVWAIGNESESNLDHAFLLHWDGTSWSHDTLADGALQAVVLQGINARSATEIWAVGRGQGDLERPFTMHWNGVSWDQVSTHIDNFGELDSVAALAPNDVWAVGHQYINNSEQPMILHFGAAVNSPTNTTPKSGTVIHKKQRVKLGWDAATCATYYEVVVKQDSKNGATVDSQTNLVTPHYKTVRLARNHKYFWNVRGCDADGCGMWAGWHSFTVSP